MTSFAVDARSSTARPVRPRLAAILHTTARARLAQFIAIGSAIFALAPRPPDARRIEISKDELAIVESAEASRHGARSLGSAQTAEVTARVIEDRMLFAEGVRLGLDRGDPIIEQRVVQKVLLLAEGLGGANREPTEAELRAAYTRSADRYRQPPIYHVMHVFAARREDLPAATALGGAALPNLGEPFPLPRDTRATRDDLRRSYGAAFADAVAARPPSQRYSEPVPSSFGWHRIRVVDVAPGRVQPFAEVERQVAFELVLQRREQTVRRFLEDTAARYEIVVDGARLTGFRPMLRLARHETASGED
jgi:hypothetical protein